MAIKAIKDTLFLRELDENDIVFIGNTYGDI